MEDNESSLLQQLCPNNVIVQAEISFTLLEMAQDIIPADGVVSIWPLQKWSFFPKFYLHFCDRNLWHG